MEWLMTTVEELFGSDFDIDKLLRKWELKKENPYVLDLIRVLWQRDLQRSMVIHEMERLRKSRNMDIPRKFAETVQSAFQQFCKDSDVFNGPPEKAIFLWPHGKRKGLWGMDRELAAAYVRKIRASD
jgi:hypothetical protein